MNTGRVSTSIPQLTDQPARADFRFPAGLRLQQVIAVLAFWLSCLLCTTAVCVGIVWGTKYYGLPPWTLLPAFFFVIVPGGAMGAMLFYFMEDFCPWIHARLGSGQLFIVCLAVGAVAGAFLGLKENGETSLWRLLGFPATASALAALVCSLIYRFYHVRYETLRHSYTQWLGAVVHDADPNASVSLARGVAWEHIWASKLVGGGECRETSNYLQTRVGQTVIEGCNVTIRTAEKDDKGETYYVEVFSGLFMRVVLSTGFAGTVILQPLPSADGETATWQTALGDQIFQPLGALWKSMFGDSPPQRINFDDGKFDRAVAVSSESAELAHRLLPYGFRRRILALSGALGGMPAMSFVDGNMYLAMSPVRFEFGDPEHLLRPRTFLRNYFTRIWEKTFRGVQLYRCVGRTLFPM